MLHTYCSKTASESIIDYVNVTCLTACELAMDPLNCSSKCYIFTAVKMESDSIVYVNVTYLTA